MTTIDKSRLEPAVPTDLNLEQGFAKIQEQLTKFLKKMWEEQDLIDFQGAQKKISEIFFKKNTELIFDEAGLEKLRDVLKTREQLIYFVGAVEENVRKFIAWVHRQSWGYNLETREKQGVLSVGFKVEGKDFQISFDKNYFTKLIRKQKSEKTIQKIHDSAAKAFEFVKRAKAKIIDLQKFLSKQNPAASDVKLLSLFLDKLLVQLDRMETNFKVLENQNWQDIMPELAESLWAYQISGLQEIKTKTSEIEQLLKAKFGNLPQGLGVSAKDQATISMLQKSSFEIQSEGEIDAAAKKLLEDLVRDDPSVVFKHKEIFKMVSDLSQLQVKTKLSGQ